MNEVCHPLCAKKDGMLCNDVMYYLYFSPNSFSYRGSYFKLGGEGSQIL